MRNQFSPNWTLIIIAFWISLSELMLKCVYNKMSIKSVVLSVTFYKDTLVSKAALSCVESGGTC